MKKVLVLLFLMLLLAFPATALDISVGANLRLGSSRDNHKYHCCTKDETVEAIEDSTVSRNNTAEILDPISPLAD